MTPTIPPVADDEAMRIAATLTKAQIHVLRHSLGVADKKRAPKTFYRSHFVTGEGSDDHPDCMALHELGLMTRQKARVIFGGMDCFNVTGRGEAVCRAALQNGGTGDE